MKLLKNLMSKTMLNYHLNKVNSFPEICELTVKLFLSYSVVWIACAEFEVALIGIRERTRS